jgi:predicted RNA-binding protein
MCESKIILKNSKEETLLEDVILMAFNEDGIKVLTLDGRESIIKEYKLSSIDFIKHIIYFTK